MFLPLKNSGNVTSCYFTKPGWNALGKEFCLSAMLLNNAPVTREMFICRCYFATLPDISRHTQSSKLEPCLPKICVLLQRSQHAFSVRVLCAPQKKLRFTTVSRDRRKFRPRRLHFVNIDMRCAATLREEFRRLDTCRGQEDLCSCIYAPAYIHPHLYACICKFVYSGLKQLHLYTCIFKVAGVLDKCIYTPAYVKLQVPFTTASSRMQLL